MAQYVFYETAGKIQAALLLEETASHFLVKGLGSNTQKIKTKDVLLSGQSPVNNPQEATGEITTIAQEIDLDLLWACAPEDGFVFGDLATEYFGDQVNLLQKAGMWQALQSAPIYFSKKGKGQYLKQAFDQIQIALVAVAKKQEKLKQQAIWVEQMVEGQAPEEILKFRDSICQKKNPNDLTYKACAEAAQQLHMDIPQLMLHIGAIASPFELHRQLFIQEYFPQGTEQLLEPVSHTHSVWEELLHEGLVSDEVSLAVSVFSIDDSSTTEIDDAFSVEYLAGDLVRVGVHIAAPSMLVRKDDPADLLAKERMSTLYTPGEKVTMLPDDWVSQCSLDEDKVRPVISIYTTFDSSLEQEAAFTEIFTKIEKVKIAKNLRHDIPEMQLSREAFQSGELAVPFGREMATLWTIAQRLSSIRDEVRGKPENNNRADFSFQIDNPERGRELTGQEKVTITQRMRGSPIDKLVSEWMIFANVQWAKWLNELKVPAMFRTQSSMGVRTTAHAQPHLAMGVPAYMWATSPLRRYCDWLNQMQLIAAVRYQTVAPMKAPYQSRDSDLLSKISQFDERYRAYNEHQNKIEKYWCLQWVQQQDQDLYEAILVREGVVRFKALPLYLTVALSADLPLQTVVWLRVNDIDWLNLSVNASVDHIEMKDAVGAG